MDKVRTTRNATGAAMTLLIIALVFVLLMILGGLWALVQLTIASQRNYTAVEAASLAAAEDLSRIVIDDPYFGKISLSDYPPTGKATLAGDGEPTAVLGINTILATARLQLLIGQELGNAAFTQLALRDCAEARRAARQLSDYLASAVSNKLEAQPKDADGNDVRPYQHAKVVYLQALAGVRGVHQPTLSRFKLSVGWLKNGAVTVTPLPVPLEMACVNKEARLNGNYKAFVGVPVQQEDFYFAALSRQAALVNGTNFTVGDGKRVCSVIKVEADLMASVDGPQSESRNASVRAVAYAVPPSLADISPSGIMVLSFPHGFVPGLRSLRDVFNHPQLQTHCVDVLTAFGGDFPVDNGSTIGYVNKTEANRPIATVFAEGFYDWLRTAHGRVRIDCATNLIDRRFDQIAQAPEHAGSGTLIFALDKHGDIVARNVARNPFPSQCVDENQNYALTFDALTANGLTWTLAYRDQVRRLGDWAGGKHAGQMMAGEPVNWCELPSYGGGADEAAQRAVGGRVLRLDLHGDAFESDHGMPGIKLAGAYFTRTNGVPLQVRKSYYSAGLAVEFQLSSPRMVGPG